MVQNEMEDGWLWVTSERTKESGLVPAPFVKDLVCVICVSDMCIGRWDGVEKKKNLWRCGEEAVVLMSVGGIKLKLHIQAVLFTTILSQFFLSLSFSVLFLLQPMYIRIISRILFLVSCPL